VEEGRALGQQAFVEEHPKITNGGQSESGRGDPGDKGEQVFDRYRRHSQDQDDEGCCSDNTLEKSFGPVCHPIEGGDQSHRCRVDNRLGGTGWMKQLIVDRS
jgi:hypothetical protein